METVWCNFLFTFFILFKYKKGKQIYVKMLILLFYSFFTVQSITENPLLSLKWNLLNCKQKDADQKTESSAVKRLIVINRIQNKSFCLHNVYMYYVYI